MIKLKLIRSKYVCLPQGLGVLFYKHYLRILLLKWNLIIRKE